MTIIGKFIAILSCILITNVGFAKTIAIKKFATSPDKHLTLYVQNGCKNQSHCQVFYQVDRGKIVKAMDLYMPFDAIPSVKWHNNLAEITTLSGTDATLSTFIEAKRGVYQVANMAHFDPKHECLLASNDRGEGLAFFHLFDNQPKQILDLIGLNVDKDWVFPINYLAVGGENKFLSNGDFQFEYWTNEHDALKKIVITNPCNNN